LTVVKQKAAEDPDALPPEDREVYLKQLNPDLVDGPIPQNIDPNILPPVEESKEFTVDSLNELQGKQYVYYAQFDTFNIEMKDGNVIKYKRMSIPEDQYDQIRDLQAEAESGISFDLEKNGTHKKLNAIEQREKEKLATELKARYYLFNMKTKQPMTDKERRNVKNHSVIGAILNSCLARSIVNAPEGKN
jgi:hypothetical protein